MTSSIKKIKNDGSNSLASNTDIIVFPQPSGFKVTFDVTNTASLLSTPTVMAADPHNQMRLENPDANNLLFWYSMKTVNDGKTWETHNQTASSALVFYFNDTPTESQPFQELNTSGATQQLKLTVVQSIGSPTQAIRSVTLYCDVTYSSSNYEYFTSYYISDSISH